MIVTKIEPVTKIKCKVYLDERFAFVLYKGELSRYCLKEGAEVADDIEECIKVEVLLKRVKLRAMHLLNHMDRTEEQLRVKLKKDLYPDDIIEKGIQYVKSYGYIGDEGYATRFISGKQNSKSKREIQILLKQKGVSDEVIQKAMESCYEEVDELVAIQKLVAKKRFCAETATEKEKKKMYEFLMRKGFRYEDIRQVIQVSFWNA